MPTMRLIPSTYYLSSTSYLSVANADNMYANTDNTSYATVTNSRANTTSYYIYLRGFNFDDVPAAATVTSITIKVKGYESGLSTSTTYAPKLYNGTTTISTASAASTSFGASSNTITVPYTGTWEDLKGYGSTLGIRCTVRRANSSTTGYLYVQGAEIAVEYTLPVSATVTSTLTGDGTISPSGAYSTYEGEEYELTITPTTKTDTVTATKNGVDITSELVGHGGAQTTASTVLGTYTLVSGGFNGSGASYFSGIVGNGVDASKTTSNYYSSSSSSTAVFTYEMNFASLPSNAIIERVYCEVNGHAESTSQSNEYMCAQLISGSTELTEEINFKDVSTSNTTVTLECEDLPTLSQLASMKLQCRLGYYGGAINGATCYVVYSLPVANPDYYTYTYVVDGDATIAVTIGAVASDTIYFKLNGSWVAATAVYKKVNGAWVAQTDLTNVFQSGVNYRKG